MGGEELGTGDGEKEGKEEIQGELRIGKEEKGCTLW